jgi:alkyl hydroperoxide reductase subunit AhpC
MKSLVTTMSHIFLVHEGNLLEISFDKAYAKQNWHTQIKNKYNENLPTVSEYSVCANTAGDVHAVFIGAEDGQLYHVFFTKQKIGPSKWDFQKILIPLKASKNFR